jgi:WD40 repeat protein
MKLGTALVRWSVSKLLFPVALGCIMLGSSACRVASIDKAITYSTEVTISATPVPTTLVSFLTPTKIKPTGTPFVTPTRLSNTEVLLKGPLVAFLASDVSGVNYVLILDLGTGNVRKLVWSEGVPIEVGWRLDGCELDTTLVSASGIRLIVSDLQNSKSKIVFAADKRADGGFATWPILDPSGKWIAYTVLSGEQTYAGAEFQNIEVVAIGNSASPTVLTTHGGASKAAWSPNGGRLAYSDYDSAGAVQLYLAKPDGKEKTQLTHFTVTDTRVSTIQWSPAGDAIAFATATEDSKRIGSLWIVSVDGVRLAKATIKNTSGQVDNIWWSDDGQNVVAYVHSADGEARGDAIHWIDPTDGTVLHTLAASDTPDKYMTQPFPVGGVQVIGFVSDKRILFYHMKTGRIEEKQYSVDWTDLTGLAEASPVTFQSEAACTIR